MAQQPLLTLKSVSKSYSGVQALSDVSIETFAGEVHCLLGDNGAGKSTLIKTMSGVVHPTSGDIMWEGQPVTLDSPKEAQELGIGTVHQDVGLIPMMSVARNFFLANEPTRGWGPFKRIDMSQANGVSIDAIRAMGISRDIDPDQVVGTMSGGEKQAIAIARAVHFGAKFLILGEPTAALGVHESEVVINLIERTKQRGTGILLITHNPTHALAVGDRFTVLTQGRVVDQFKRGERDQIMDLMAGGRRLAAAE
ncbi:Arabinose import ATP-binding protein AraG [Pelagimonas phthalicica]|uniref:Arabinose import ATP-binding protein AraG n=1 Tax=Pelagimonas phthalicica TaxID=1037362 RepID=A0A238JEW0_9RHOB|nr:ATP-binding cassette domain-containing protein [Pelagimonas phthalicica]TDS92144.1 simple sugar transport system ATP-binding protein [Pelagimonas phthalicica]SMX29198.1 Arabinose import ATP-binding protein AraG [Pelagimonas phthalicica]